MKLAHIADKVAADIYTKKINPNVSTADVVRDYCDLATGSELSCSMLDRLCDMVERRLRNSTKPGGLFWRTHLAHGHPVGRGGGTSYDFPGGPDCPCKETA